MRACFGVRFSERPIASQCFAYGLRHFNDKDQTCSVFRQRQRQFQWLWFVAFNPHRRGPTVLPNNPIPERSHTRDSSDHLLFRPLAAVYS